MATHHLGLVSDTHGWVDPELLRIFTDADVERIIHAGDIGNEEVLTTLKTVAPVSAVRGNIDGGPLRFLPLEETVTVGGRTIAILHIAGNPRRPRPNARDLLRRIYPDVLVVGHSHIPVVGRVGETLWINPGAAGRVGFHHERHAAILHVDKKTGEISLDRVHLGPRAIIKD